MKSRSTIFLMLLFLGIVIGCKKENSHEGPNTEFLESEILLNDGAGTSVVTVVWDFSEWEISTSGDGFISNLSFLKGGDINRSSSTRVQFDHGENNTSGVREQEIILKNLTTGETQKIIIKQNPKPAVILTVQTSTTFQNISGFGGMLNPALWQGNNQLTSEEVDRLYGPNGLGYKILRMMIYPDPATWDRDLAVAQKAQALGVRIFGSPWTPPAHMKSSKQQGGGNGGYLLPEYYQEYVDHLNAFVDYMASNGVTIEAVSIQNEPDWDPEYDACVWSPSQILAFMKDYAHGIKVKVIAAEAVNFKKEYTDPVLNDATARNNLDIVGTHLYGGGIGDYPLARQNNKEIWMTEHLLNTDNSADYSWEHALMLGKEVHECMEANFNAYVWWYLKRHYSMLGDGEYDSPKGIVQKRGYVLSHYAKYATGRKRVLVDKIQGNDNFMVTAYEGNSDITLVIQNHGTTTIPALQFDLPVTISSVSAEETSETADMVAKAVVLSSDNKSVTVTIEPNSIVSIKLSK